MNTTFANNSHDAGHQRRGNARGNSSNIDPKALSESLDPSHKEESQIKHVNGAPVSIQTNDLKRDLRGRHMQMIAIGGAIGAGLFVSSGSALSTGGPASLLIGFIIIGVNILMMMQALTELAVMYPVNGAFYTYFTRFLDPSWGFAMGWEYAIQWLCVLPFEITAASITIKFWDNGSINIGVWIAVFLSILCIIQIFGVRGYGEVEFILSMIKIIACTGFIILGIIINCGSVPTDNRGYIGVRYWHNPYQAFRNGFQGFCSVFVTASLAYGGTELTGLAAAESQNPLKQIPKAATQVFWRIAFFYITNLFVLGLIVPSNSDDLLHSTGANTKYSPFVLAMELAGIKVLPSIFNAVITISVISVANSATYGSTRTIQALATQGMAPKFLAYVDKAGRPVSTVILQLVFGLLAFVNEVSAGAVLFGWLLALAGIVYFFIYGSICLAHVRFRKAWHLNGHTDAELPYRAAFGIWGSWLGLVLNSVCLVAQFYTALFPLGGSPSAKAFFEAFLAAPLIIFFYLFWKTYSWFMYPSHRPLFIRARDIDIYTGMRQIQHHAPEVDDQQGNATTKVPLMVAKSIMRALF